MTAERATFSRRVPKQIGQENGSDLLQIFVFENFVMEISAVSTFDSSLRKPVP
jgi:hypothetical protein